MEFVWIAVIAIPRHSVSEPVFTCPRRAVDQALAAGVKVGIVNLHRHAVAPRRPVPDRQSHDQSVQGRADVNINNLEAHYLAGGNVDRVVDS